MADSRSGSSSSHAYQPPLRIDYRIPAGLMYDKPVKVPDTI